MLKLCDLESRKTSKGPSEVERPSSQEVLKLAGEQYGLVTRSQLRNLGMSGRKVDIRIRNRRLLPVGNRTGVYAVGRPIDSRRAICMAATLAAGEGSMVSGRAAADLWDFRAHKGEIDLVRTHSRKPRTFWLEGEGIVGRHKVVVHRSRHLPDADRTRRHGIPVMNVSRLFVDLSAQLSDKLLYDAFKEADMKSHLNEKELSRCAGLGRGWKGIKRFRKLVAMRHPDMKDARTRVEGVMVDEAQRAAGRHVVMVLLVVLVVVVRRHGGANIPRAPPLPTDELWRRINLRAVE